MAIEVIGTIKPKNGAKFPIVEAEDVAVVTSKSASYNMTMFPASTTRCSYQVAYRFTLDRYNACRIDKVGVKAAAGATVRFALFKEERGEGNTGIIRLIDVLGDAVADSASAMATLTFENGYFVRENSTIILALAESAAIQCFETPGMYNAENFIFEDANYFDIAEGTQINVTYPTGAEGESRIAWSLFLIEADYIKEQTLEEFANSMEVALEELPESGGGVSSWNDLTDKPFYEEGEAVELFKEQEIVGWTADGLILQPALFILEEGEKYRVVWNGVSYELVCHTQSQLFPGLPCVGDLHLDDSGNIQATCPVSIVYLSEEASEAMGQSGSATIIISAVPNADGGWDVDAAETHTLAVYHDNTVIKTLDAKYLPSATAIDLSAYESDGKIVETFADGTVLTTVMEFDSNGKPTKITDSNGNVTVLTW